MSSSTKAGNFGEENDVIAGSLEYRAGKVLNSVYVALKGIPMSLKLIEAEIRRFLASSVPEVLCIRGKWGIGKTYSFNKILNDAKQENALSLGSYSYVSLFGLNSIDDLRFAIFERTVSGTKVGTPPDTITFSQLFGKETDLARRAKPIVDMIASLVNRKGVTDILFKSAFLSVRQQIICLDDLERAGNGLELRDVLGLVAALKEERQCKVVFLLNSYELNEESKIEFEKQLEKVADIMLDFDLTSKEAVSIALSGAERTALLLRPRIEELGIVNIRVIKKIERLAGQLIALLDGFDDTVIEQAIATLVLASWSVQQPKEAPPLSFLREFNSYAMSARREAKDPDIERYSKMLANYPYNNVDALDQIVMDGVKVGYFNSEVIRSEAAALQLILRQRSRDSAFSRVWSELYYGSLVTEDDEFLDALVKSILDEAASISVINFNSAIRVLREYGRSTQADELVARYVTAHEADGSSFFSNNKKYFWRGERLDDCIREAFAAKHREFVDVRDPLMVLAEIGRSGSWNDEDVSLMARQSVDDFERMFEALRGEVMQSAIEKVLLMGRSNHEEAASIQQASHAALRRIAEKSPMRRSKVSRFGVNLEDGDRGTESGPT